MVMIGSADALSFLKKIDDSQEEGYSVFNSDPIIDFYIAGGLISAQKSQCTSTYPWVLKLTPRGVEELRNLKRFERSEPIRKVFLTVFTTILFTALSWWLSSLGFKKLSLFSETIISVIVFYHLYTYAKREEKTHLHTRNAGWSSIVGGIIIASAVATYFLVDFLMDTTIENVAQQRFLAGYDEGYEIGYSKGYDDVSEEENDLAYWLGWGKGVEDAYKEIENEYGIKILDEN